MKKINLNKETIRTLTALEMRNAAGGGVPTEPCITLGCLPTIDCPLPSRGVGDCHTFYGNNCGGSETTIIVCC